MQQVYALLKQAPNLDDVLRLVMANASGPAIDPFALPHLDPVGRARASIPAMVQDHAANRVLCHRPADTTEQEESGDE